VIAYCLVCLLHCFVGFGSKHTKVSCLPLRWVSTARNHCRRGGLNRARRPSWSASQQPKLPWVVVAAHCYAHLALKVVISIASEGRLVEPGFCPNPHFSGNSLHSIRVQLHWLSIGLALDRWAFVFGLIPTCPLARPVYFARKLRQILFPLPQHRHTPRSTFTRFA
jgi:hypothetical protein